MVLEDESMNIIAGNRAAGRHGTKAETENLHPFLKVRGRERKEWCGLLKPQNPFPLINLLILPKYFHPLVTKHPKI